MRAGHCNLRRLCAVMLTLGIAAPGHGADEWRFSGVERVVAVADIHGAHDAFVRVLRRSAVIGDELRWIAGATHLVIVGDVLDRGPDSRRSLDLIRRLEGEASAAGGAVHLALGNHELMNLTGDLRYVSAEEYAAFAPEESLVAREAALAEVAGAVVGQSDNAELRAELDARYPPGFFAHRDAFSADGEYGAWLLEKPVVVVIDDTAFVHGGFSDLASELGADGLNLQLGEQIREYADGLARLIDGGVLRHTDNFYDHEMLITAFAERVTMGDAAWPNGLEQTAARLAELSRSDVFAGAGPLWYRGNVGCSAVTEKDRLAAAFDEIGVTRLVIGHTPTSSARIETRLEDSVVRVDTGMLNDFYGGRAAALVIEGGKLSAFYEDAEDSVSPIAQPRRVGRRPSNMTARELEAFLLNAEITAQDGIPESDDLSVTLSLGGVTLTATFTPGGRGGSLPEVAAYRLDRLLGLEMVPVTVPREVDGDLGSLQFAPAGVITEVQRSAERRGAAAWCPLRDQFQSMYVFDSLIFNEGRTLERIRYSTDNFQLILVGHDDAWSTSRGRPAHLSQAPLEIGPGWRDALAALDADRVAEELGEVLDSRRVRALLRRRDELLEMN